MDFSKKNILVLTDGSQGMISQVKGLAQEFSNKIYSIETKLLFPWSKLQPGLLPVYKWIFKNDFDLTSKPKVVISCGRKSVYASSYLKKKFQKNIVTIHIQNPRIQPSSFDFVITPNHDKLIGKNVLKFHFSI